MQRRMLERMGEGMKDGLKIYDGTLPLVYRIIAAIPWLCCFLGFCVFALLIGMGVNALLNYFKYLIGG